MATVNANSSGITEILGHIDNAKEYMIEAIDDIWSAKFNAAYNEYIGADKLEGLYSAAENGLNSLIGNSSVVVGVKTTPSAGSSAQVAIGTSSLQTSLPTCPYWILSGAGVGAVGVKTSNIVNSTSSITYKRDKKTAFETLLSECAGKTNANYTALTELQTKIDNVYAAMQNVMFKISEYETQYANLEETINEMAAEGITVELEFDTEDGVTVLGIKTTVTITDADGNPVTIELTTSEAMNAFYTHSNVFMNAEIAADYLEREYGATIDYGALVTNTNALMTASIENDLYTHEFVDVLLDTYLPDLDAAKDVTSSTSSIELDDLNAILEKTKADYGDLGMYASLLGVGLLGPVGSTFTKKPANPDPPEITDPPENNDPPGTYTQGGPYGYTPGGPSTGTNPTETPTEEEKPTEEEPTETVENPEFKLEEIVDTEIPEEVTTDVEKDYDQLARDAYEFGNSVEDIISHRNDLIEEFQRAYETGDLTSIEAKLKQYGYSDAEIEAILNDRYLAFKALLEGDERAMLAESAMAMAAADGIENFESAWSQRPSFDSLANEGPSDLLTMASNDDNIRQLKTDADAAQEAYLQKVDETNNVLKEVSESRAKVDELKEKFAEKYGDDTSKWDKEAIAEYNEAVKEYNEKAGSVADQLAALEEAKTAYTDAMTKLDDAKKAYYESMSGGVENEETMAPVENGEYIYVMDGEVVGGGTINGDDGIGVSGDGSTANISGDGLGVSGSGDGDTIYSDEIRVTETGIGFKD